MTSAATTSDARRFLVTGGAGFIGYRTVDALLAADASAEVAIFDNLSVGLPLPVPRSRLTMCRGDIRDRDAVRNLVRDFRPDTIVHLAAVHHIPTCERERAYALEVNVFGTELLLEAAEALRVPRFVLASSGAVYEWSDGPLSEFESALRPSDNYSLAKFSNEIQLRFWAARTDGFARVARIFNTIGHDDPNAHLIPDIIAQLPVGQAAASIALGNLEPRRDYIHADDTARALAAIARERGPAGVDVYNVASGADVSVAQLVTLLGEVLGIHISVSADPARQRRVDRPSQLAATARIEARLGFRISKSLRVALEDIVRHHRREPAQSQ